MKKPEKIIKGGMDINEGVKGEPIELQIERMIQNKEPIKDAAPLVYTERKEGVKAEMNIRTDRFEVAIDATTKIQKSYSARREERMKINEENDGKAKPLHDTSGADNPAA